MKTRLLLVLPALVFFAACDREPAQTADEREREIQRVVEQRLADERRAEQERLAVERDADLSDREKQIKARERETERERERIAEAREAAEREAAERERERERERPEPVAESGPAQSYELFYESLDSHGDWIELGGYGYVFRPAAARNPAWRPYNNGHWAYSDYGWTWISDEPFGWATYHYGRWTRARGLGWVWVPGEEWAPAWVSWRASDEYVGWAPLPPEAEYNGSVGISTWADSTYDIAPAQYTFVTVNNFSAPVVEQTVIAPQENITIINKTVNVTNIKTRNSVVINEGPSFNAIKARSERPIQRLRVERTRNARGQNAVVRGDTLQISAPVVKRATVPAQPRRVTERVKSVAIETGWGGVSEQQSQHVRRKWRGEAVAAKTEAAAPRPEAPVRRAAQPVARPTAPAPTASPEPVQTPNAARAVKPSPEPTAESAPVVRPRDQRPNADREAEGSEGRERAIRQRQRAEMEAQRKQQAEAAASPAGTPATSPVDPGTPEPARVRKAPAIASPIATPPPATPAPATPLPAMPVQTPVSTPAAGAEPQVRHAPQDQAARQEALREARRAKQLELQQARPEQRRGPVPANRRPGAPAIEASESQQAPTDPPARRLQNRRPTGQPGVSPSPAVE